MATTTTSGSQAPQLKVVRLPLPDGKLDLLFCAVMRHARERTGLSEAGFADAVNRRLGRTAWVCGDAAVHAYESIPGAFPGLDVFAVALQLAGYPLVDYLRAWLSEEEAGGG